MSGITAVVVRPDGTAERITLPGDPTERLKAMQDLVGGYLEALPILRTSGDPAYGWVNEDGKNLNLPVNALAKDLADDGRWPGEPIVGVMVITGDADDIGFEQSIPADLAGEILSMTRSPRTLEP